MKNVGTLLLLTISISLAYGQESKLDTLIKNTVLVRCDSQRGSGVLFKNGSTIFVWTAAHILDHHQKIKVVIDAKSGELKAKISYHDVEVAQPIYEDGRKVGEISFLASILRYSDGRLGGEDLALLKIYKKNAFGAEGISFLSKGIPKSGDSIWHVGSMAGEEGINTPSEGMFTVAGRLRKNFSHDELRNPLIYDQVNVPALGGCSGGGVFLKSSGECIGLLTDGPPTAVESPNYIVPARRIREFAKRTKCEWAIDSAVKIPALDDQPVTDRDLPIPKAFVVSPKNPASTPNTWQWWLEKIIRAYWR
jgi:hypothetical protein